MGTIAAIAVNTFREIIRQRVFLLVLVLTAAALLVLLIFPYFTIKQETEMFKDLALSTATLAMVLLVALTASSAMAEELESRTAMTLLSKPVARWQFLLGKYLGVLLALLVATAIMTAILFVTTYIRVTTTAFPSDRRLAFTFSESQPAREFQALMLRHALDTVPGGVMIFYQGMVLSAVAVVLASRFSRVMAVMVTFGLFLVGHLAEFLQGATTRAADAVRIGATWGGHLMPFLGAFNLTSTLAHGEFAPGSPEFAELWRYTAMAGVYAVGYAAFILLVGAALLHRREMT